MSGQAHGPSLMPTTFLSTIFMDNGQEREGSNIGGNINAMISFISGEFVAPDANTLCFDPQVLSRLTSASRALPFPPIQPEAATRPPSQAALSPVAPERSVTIGHTSAAAVSVPRSMRTARITRNFIMETNGEKDVNEESFKKDSTRFVTTVRGMYGDGSPQDPYYAQDRKSALMGLLKKATESNLLDDAGELDEDNHLNNAPAGLSRILKADGLASNVAQAAAKACPHCDLSRDDPPVFQIMLPEANPHDGTGATTNLHQRIAENATLKKRRYGNLALGILAPTDTFETLWNLVSILQPPKQLQLANHPPNARPHVPQLSMDEWSLLAKNHFAAHIGAPPWQEYFVRRRADLEAWAGMAQKECQSLTQRIREAQKEADGIKFRLTALERVMAARNPADERSRLQGLLSSTQQELVLRRWELADAERRSERERLANLKGKALIAVTQEEIRRLLAQISDMVLVSATLDLPRDAEFSKSARERVLSVLEEMPTARGASVSRILNSTHDAHQCPACLMLTVTSPYCPVTGEPHGDLLSNLFEELSMAGPSFHDAPDPQHDGEWASHSTSDVEGEASGDDPNTNAIQQLNVSALANSVRSTDVSSPHAATKTYSPRSPRQAASKLVRPQIESSLHSPKQGARAPRHRSRREKTKLRTERDKHMVKMEAARRRVITKILGSSSEDEASDESLKDEDSPPATHRESFSSASDMDEGAHGNGVEERPGSLRKGDQTAGSLAVAQHGTQNDRKNRGQRAMLDRPTFPARDWRIGVSHADRHVAVRPSTIAMEVMTNHLWKFLSAAADKNFPMMRMATRQLAGPLCTALFTDATLRSLTESEEQFYSWYSIVGQLLPTSVDGSIASLVKRAKTANYKIIEQRCISLRKELRNLEYAFQKRPKGRTGAHLDDSSFAALALKISDLEKKNATLRIKLRQVNEQRRALNRSNAGGM